MQISLKGFVTFYNSLHVTYDMVSFWRSLLKTSTDNAIGNR